VSSLNIYKAAFLDRDGVINRSQLVDGVPKPPKSLSEVEILDGVIESIQLLKRCGYIPVVITNQPDVARGQAQEKDINTIHSYISSVVRIDHFYSCFHDDSDKCGCRKPAPGLIYKAVEELQIDLSNSILIGDRWRDIQAGQTAGCKSYFIDYSYPEKQPENPFIRVSSLLEAAQLVLRNENEKRKR